MHGGPGLQSLTAPLPLTEVGTYDGDVEPEPPELVPRAIRTLAVSLGATAYSQTVPLSSLHPDSSSAFSTKSSAGWMGCTLMG